MFQLLTGSFHALEKTFLANLQDERKRDTISNLLVLSPSGRLLTHLQSKLAHQHSGLINIHFLTFYALAERVLADSGYTEQVVTDSELVNELIRRILIGETPEAVDLTIREALHIDKNVTIPRGLAGALAATMRDVRDSGMRADYALQAAQQGFLGAEAPEAASTLALYGRLTGLLQKYRLRTSADLLRRAAERAPTHSWIQNQKAIFLYGFYDLTGVQLDLVLSLADHPNARVYFPYEEGNPAYAYADKLLSDPAFAQKISTKRSVCPGQKLERGASFAQGKSSNVEVFSCSGARDEVWLTAKEILRLSDNGVPFHEIAVISRNLAPYLSAFREIFGAHQIPYVSARAEAAGSHPLVKTVRALLTLDDRHPQAKTRRDDLEKSPYIHSPVSDVKDTGPRITNFRGDVKDGDDVNNTWSSHIAWANEQLEKFIRLPQDTNLEESALLKAIGETLEALRILDTLEEPISRRHFLDAWQEKVDALERPEVLRPFAGVQALEVQQARGLSFRAVFMLGMNEKVFPRLIREDPFLSDAARSSLAQATGCRLGRKLDGYEEERLLFQLTRQAATNYLYILTQRSDEEGKALIPSVYLKELGARWLEPKRLPRSIADKFEHRPALTWTPKELSFLMNRAQLDPKEIYTALSWNIKDYYKLLAAHRAIEGFKPGIGPHDGVIEDLSQLKGALAKPFSPSSLEDLAECPYQYYAAHILRITPKEELAPGGEMTPQALGKLFHRTLELFYRNYFTSSSPAASGGGSTPPDGSPTTTSGMTGTLERAVDNCFEEFHEHLSLTYPLAIKSSKETIFKELLSFIKSDIEEINTSGYRPTWFEQALEGQLPIASLPYGFFGRPDRLDVRQEGTTQVRVVDYKSGKPKPWTGRIETQIIQGKFLQLPIYLGLAGAFAQTTIGKPVTATDATLRPIRKTEEESTEKTLTSDFWQTPSASIFADNIREMIGVIEKGSFYIEPSTGEWGYCARCHFAAICRKEHMPTRIRAERDPLRVRVSEKLARTAPANEAKEKKSKGKAPADVR